MSGMVSSNDWEFLPVWKQNIDPYRESIIALWRNHARLPEAEIQKRLSEVILIARYKSETVGVSTAYVQTVKLLNNHEFAFYRFFVAPKFRTAGIDQKITKQSVEILERYYLQDFEQPVKGVIAMLENEHLKSLRAVRKAIWANVPFVFIGNSSTGHPIRVYYFKGAYI